MQCNSCHQNVPEDMVFCPNCGANLASQKANEPTASQLQEKLRVAEERIENLQYDLENKKSTPAGVIAALVILSIACLIISILAIVKSNEAKSSAALLNDSLDRANTCTQQMEALFPQGIAVQVTDLRQISLAGSEMDATTLYSGMISSLVFDINVYLSDEYTSVGGTIYAKVIKPDGSIVLEPGGSSDYSFTIPAETGSYTGVKFGSDYTAHLFDQRGTYLVLFLYNDELITSRGIWIN
jgi:uncharacterized Zn finger protein (UPF0148 family)